MNNEEVFLVGLLALALVVLAWSVLSFQQPGLQNTQQNYQQFVSAENPSDICATPAGYTVEQWKDHLSHHPDRYAQCL